MISRFEFIFNCKIGEVGRDYGKELEKGMRDANKSVRATVSYYHETNLVAKRWNQMMLENVCTLLAASELPRFLWPLAMEYTIFIRNRLLHRSLPDGKSPIEITQPSINIIA